MAVKRFMVTRNATDTGTSLVTYSSTDAIGTGIVSLLIDDTKTVHEIYKAATSALRALERQIHKSNLASAFPTSGTTQE